MLYSRWRPSGGFDYYMSGENFNIGDDLPVPSLPGVAGGIGVPAQECGRPMPLAVKFVGRGFMPQGLVAAPGAVEAVRGVSWGSAPESTTAKVLLLFGGTLAGWLLSGVF